MDEADTWHLEGDLRIREALDRLIEKLQESPVVARFSIDNPEQVVELLGWMRTSSALMLLHYSTDDRREVLDLFVNACTEILKTRPDDENTQRAASVAIERFLAFERIALLGRLFSPERAQVIEKAVADAVRIVDTESYAGRENG
ncbi:hypothetical protein EZI54_07260 [Marinobacter halodurans]|uniref:Transcriptional regulator TetR C-terminal Proteobacteria type domain-containing protein n=2 Tax=Marinobacter halodurans TaxID=2528979 RepID=A0ABY1ZPD4_9GAMM|nr:hypothetical protein [Marinobacter halodurans]TBW57450.1 hypothetical protein EZI54_07260 [Marinobacter halodurans]